MISARLKALFASLSLAVGVPLAAQGVYAASLDAGAGNETPQMWFVELAS